VDQLLAGATSDVHFLMKLVAAAPCSFAAVAASVQHFLAELVSAAPCRFFGPIVDWQVAPAASAGAVAGAAAAGAGAGAGACANAAPVTKSDAATIAIILIFSLPGDVQRTGAGGGAIFEPRRSGSPCRRSPADTAP